MKILTALTATLVEAPYQETRGIQSLLHEHPALKGWFIRAQLGSAGLHLWHTSLGADGQPVKHEIAIPLDALLALAALHEPALLPSPADMTAFLAAKQQPVKKPSPLAGRGLGEGAPQSPK